LIAIILLLSLGLGISLAVFNVFFRDIGHLFSIILQFWFWLTPIVYPISAIPNKLQWVLQLNPMTPVIESFQMILVHSQWPNWNNLIYPAIAGLLSFLLGIHLFNKLSEEIIDEL
jgi:lipopolysaccharide transport system permease protein